MQNKHVHSNQIYDLFYSDLDSHEIYNFTYLTRMSSQYFPIVDTIFNFTTLVIVFMSLLILHVLRATSSWDAVVGSLGSSCNLTNPGLLGEVGSEWVRLPWDEEVGSGSLRLHRGSWTDRWLRSTSACVWVCDCGSSGSSGGVGLVLFRPDGNSGALHPGVLSCFDSFLVWWHHARLFWRRELL